MLVFRRQLSRITPTSNDGNTTGSVLPSVLSVLSSWQSASQELLIVSANKVERAKRSCVCFCILALCVCVCVFIKLHITAQSGPVILVILCHLH